MTIAKQTKKQKWPRISPTRAPMKKCREMVENTIPKDYIEYINICKTEERRKEKATEDIGKHNL